MKARLPGRNPDFTQAAYEETTLCENPCVLIKDIYYPNEHWSKCKDELARKLTLIKKMMRLKCPDLSELEVLKYINSMSIDDIKDFIDEDLQAVEKSSTA